MIYLIAFLAGVAVGAVGLFLLAWAAMVVIARGDH